MTTIWTTYPSLTNEAIEEARKIVGVELRRPRPRKSVAAKDAIIEYSRHIGSRNPLYIQETYASGTYLGGLIAHPTWLFCVDDTILYPKLPGIHAIYAGVTWEWFRPIRIGDSFTATAQITGIEENEGGFCGRMVLQTGDIVYRNQYGQIVARATPRVFRTPRNEAKRRAKYANVEKYNYQMEEIQKVYAAYDDEYIHGESARYWETQAEDEELPPLMRGPLTTEDINLFISTVRGTLTFKAFLDHWRRHPADAYIDPQTGMPDSWDTSFLKDDPAREFGFPSAHDAGLQRVAWLEDMVTNWMGDLAFLRRLDVRLTRPCIHGDSTWCKGNATKKYRNGSEHLIDLNVRCENQRGEVTATGTATVSLVSKDPDGMPPILTADRPLS